MRIDDPNPGNTELKIIVYALLHFRKPVVFRKDFDAEKRGLSDNLFVRSATFHDTYVRDPKAGWTDLDTLFSQGEDPQRTFEVKEITSKNYL